MAPVTNGLWTRLSRTAVVRRFVLIALAATFAMFTVWAVIRQAVETPPGDYEVRQGDILLGDGKFDQAIERFGAALTAAPHHRGAMMGRAIALLELGRLDQAEAAFGEVIAFLSTALSTDDTTGRAVLAGAYANRGILYDRSGRYADALRDYTQALAIDPGAVEGPGLFHKILYGIAHPSTIRGRAAYLERQLALPAGERVLRILELDARQRMYKP